MAEPRNRKWRSRRLFVGLLGIGLVVADKIYCVESGLEVEWFEIFTGKVVLLALFAAGFLTATDLLNRWMNGKNGANNDK